MRLSAKRSKASSDNGESPLGRGLRSGFGRSGQLVYSAPVWVCDVAMAESQELVRDYEKECECEAFELNAFGEDRGLDTIGRKLEELDGMQAGCGLGWCIRVLLRANCGNRPATGGRASSARGGSGTSP